MPPRGLLSFSFFFFLNETQERKITAPRLPIIHKLYVLHKSSVCCVVPFAVPIPCFCLDGIQQSSKLGKARWLKHM